MPRKKNEPKTDSSSDDGNRISNEELKEGIRKERMERLASQSETQLRKDIENGKTESKLDLKTDFKIVLQKEEAEKDISDVKSEDILSGSLNVKKPESSIFKEGSFFPGEEQTETKKSGLFEFSNKNLVEADKKNNSISSFFNDAYKNKPADLFTNTANKPADLFTNTVNKPADLFTNTVNKPADLFTNTANKDTNLIENANEKSKSLFSTSDKPTNFFNETVKGTSDIKQSSIFNSPATPFANQEATNSPFTNQTSNDSLFKNTPAEKKNNETNFFKNAMDDKEKKEEPSNNFFSNALNNAKTVEPKEGNNFFSNALNNAKTVEPKEGNNFFSNALNNAKTVEPKEGNNFFSNALNNAKTVEPKEGNNFFSNAKTVEPKEGNNFFSNAKTVEPKEGNNFFSNAKTVDSKEGNNFFSNALNNAKTVEPKEGNNFFSNANSAEQRTEDNFFPKPTESFNFDKPDPELKTNVKLYEEPNHKLKLALKKYFQLYGKKIKLYDSDIEKYNLDENYIYSFINNDDKITSTDDLNTLMKKYDWTDNNINYFLSLYCCANNIINKNILTVENIKEIYFNTFDVNHINSIYDFITAKDRNDFLYDLYTRINRKHNLNNLVYNGLHSLVNEHLISSNITLKKEDEEFIEKYFAINNKYEKQIFDINLLVELIYCNIGDELRRNIFTQLTLHSSISNILLDKIANYESFKYAYETLVIFKNNQYGYRRVIPSDYLNEKILKLLIEEYGIIEKNEYIDHVLLYIKELYSSIVEHSANIRFSSYNRALFVGMIRTVHSEFFNFINLFNLREIINILIVNYKHMYNQLYFNMSGLQWILGAVKIPHDNSIYYRTMAVYNMGNRVIPVLPNYINSIMAPFIFKTYESFGELMLYYYKETGNPDIFIVYEQIGAIVTPIRETDGSKKQKYSYFPIPELTTDIFYNLMAVRLILLGTPKLDCTHALYSKVLKIVNKNIDVNFSGEFNIKDFKEGTLLQRYMMLTQNPKNLSLLKKEYDRACYCNRIPTEGDIKYVTGLLIAMMKIRGNVKICGCGRKDVVEVARQILQ